MPLSQFRSSNHWYINRPWRVSQPAAYTLTPVSALFLCLCTVLCFMALNWTWSRELYIAQPRKTDGQTTLTQEISWVKPDEALYIGEKEVWYVWMPFNEHAVHFKAIVPFQDVIIHINGNIKPPLVSSYNADLTCLHFKASQRDLKVDLLKGQNTAASKAQWQRLGDCFTYHKGETIVSRCRFKWEDKYHCC